MSSVPNGLLRALSETTEAGRKSYRRFVWQQLIAGEADAGWLFFRAIEDGTAPLMIAENSKTYRFRSTIGA